MKILFSILAILLIITGFRLFDNTEKTPTLHTIVTKIFNKTGRNIEKNYFIHPSGEGGAMLGGIVRKLMLAFDTNRHLSKENLRELLIECNREVLKEVNSNEDIQKYLVERPFTEKNIEIIIYNHDKTGQELSDPDISIAEIVDGVLTYSTLDVGRPLQFKNTFSETYEEALQALKNQ